MGTSKGAVQLRYNYYPKIEDFGRVKPGQMRCGEHTDYGAITVLFQDENEGLEVELKLPMCAALFSSCLSAIFQQKPSLL